MPIIEFPCIDGNTSSNFKEPYIGYANSWNKLIIADYSLYTLYPDVHFVGLHDQHYMLHLFRQRLDLVGPVVPKADIPVDCIDILIRSQSLARYIFTQLIANQDILLSDLKSQFPEEFI